MEEFNSQIKRIKNMARTMGFHRYNFLLLDLQNSHNAWNKKKLLKQGYTFKPIQEIPEVRHKGKSYEALFVN